MAHKVMENLSKKSDGVMWQIWPDGSSKFGFKLRLATDSGAACHALLRQVRRDAPESTIWVKLCVFVPINAVWEA